MPNPYRHDTHRLKAEIVARIEAGASIRAICAAPGMPAASTVAQWLRNDPVFAGEVAAARGRAGWRRVAVLDEAKAAAMLARVREGETFVDVLGQPGMPTWAQFKRWRTFHPEFAEAVFPLVMRRSEKLAARNGSGRRLFDQTVADRVAGRLAHRLDLSLAALLSADPDLPCLGVVTRWRREQPAFDEVLKAVMAHRRRRGRPPPPARVKDITDHIVMGGSFLSYSRLRRGPSYGTLRRWMRDPAFARAVAVACDTRQKFLWDKLDDYALTLPPAPIRKMERAIGPRKRQIVRLRNRPRKALWPKPRRAKGRDPTP